MEVLPMNKVQTLITHTKKDLFPMLEEMFGVKLDYSIDSLIDLENHINEQYPAPHQPLAVTTFVPYGIYLGEMIIKNIGGEWTEDEGNNDFLGIRIELDGPTGEKQVVYPLRRIAKFWEDRTDTIAGFYNMINMIVNGDLMEKMMNSEGEWIDLPDGTRVRGFKQDPSKVN